MYKKHRRRRRRWKGVFFILNPKKTVKSTPIYYYSRSERLELILSDNTIPYISAPGIYEELNGDITLDIEIPVSDPKLARIENDGRMVTQNIDGEYMEFIIREIEDKDGVKTVRAEGGEYELLHDILHEYVQASVNIRDALKAVLEGSRWEVGEIDNLYEHRSLSLKHMTKRRAINEIVNAWRGEIKYRVEVNGNRITRRYIDVSPKRGSTRGNPLVAGRDIISTTRTMDSSDNVTALVGYGAADEDGHRLTFADVEWRKKDGDPVDKPLGQNFVGDPEALAKWGYEGGRKHKKGIYDGQEEDPAELLLNTWKELQERNSLRDTYEVEVVQLGELLDIPHDKIRVGDSVRVVNHDVYPPIEMHAAVVGYEHNLNNSKFSKCTIGHFRAKLDTDSRLDKIEKDYNEKRGEWESKPSKGQVNESIAKAREELEKAIADIEKSGIDLETAKKLIQDTIDNPQDYKGTIEGLIIAKELIIQDTVTASNATIAGRLTASELTLLEAAIERANIINANIQDATITGELIGVTGTFGKVIAKDDDGFLLEKDGVAQKVAPENNLLRNHSFEIMDITDDYLDTKSWSTLPSRVDYWELKGNPRAPFFYHPTDRRAYPPFGEGAIIVRNANYVKQTIGQQLKGNAVYTISGHFKRQWNLTPGKPRFEVDLIDGLSYEVKERLINEVFETVPTDYSVQRLAATFEVPSVSEYDFLEVKISGGDDNWVQCDGVQLVQSDKPTTYLPEEGSWDIIKGMYSVKNNTSINLWSGVMYPTEDQSLKPSKRLYDCANGWMLQWQRYVKGEGVADNTFQYSFIPKEVAIGKSFYIPLGRGSSYLYKYLFIYNDRIEGHSSNSTGNRHEIALTRVIEW